MTSTDLSHRDSKWVSEARVVGAHAERTLKDLLTTALGNDFEVQAPVPKLKVYSDGKGIVPDMCVVNRHTGKRIFIEKKAGNKGGNAHERVYKYLSPALKETVSGMFDTPDNPFFLIFSGETFQEQKYLNEFRLLLRNDNYAVMLRGNTNISEVADQIKELLL